MKFENMVTISTAAEEYGVTVQRMHQLIDIYDVKTVSVNSRLKLVQRKELRKIPMDRRAGRKKSEI